MPRPRFVLVILATACSFTPPGGGGGSNDDIGSVGSTDAASGGATTSASATGAADDPDGTAGGSGSDGGPVVTTTASTGPDPSPTTDDDATGSDEGATSTGPAMPSCTSALLVTGNVDVASSQDAPFYDRLGALGIAVTVVHNADSEPQDAEGHCLVLLSAIGSASDVNDAFRNVAVPVVTWEYALYDNMRMVNPNDDNAWGIEDPLDDIAIIDQAHPLAAGLAGTEAFYVGGGRIAWGVPAVTAQVVATVPNNASRATLFAYEAGVVMADGFVAPARRVGFPGGETSAALTANAVELFEAAVLWAIG